MKRQQFLLIVGSLLVVFASLFVSCEVEYGVMKPHFLIDDYYTIDSVDIDASKDPDYKFWDIRLNPKIVVSPEKFHENYKSISEEYGEFVKKESEYSIPFGVPICLLLTKYSRPKLPRLLLAYVISLTTGIRKSSIFLVPLLRGEGNHDQLRSAREHFQSGR